MHFFYIPIKHPLGAFKEFVDFIYLEVLCNANSRQQFDPKLLRNGRKFSLIVDQFQTSTSKESRAFFLAVEGMFKVFSTLQGHVRASLKKAYRKNINVGSLCNSNSLAGLTTYADLRKIHLGAALAIAKFYKLLNSSSFRNMAAFKKCFGSYQNHFENLQAANGVLVCPACGLSRFESGRLGHAEPYDHFLPKSKYPFLSIAMSNLSPICHKCNSGYKGAKDPLFNKNKKRRKAFYPYDKGKVNLRFTVKLGKKWQTTRSRESVLIDIESKNRHEEIKTWNDLFRIQDRYADMCANPNAKDWLEKIRIGRLKNSGYLDMELSVSRQTPLSDANFLRAPFLEACKSKGLVA